MAEVCDPDETGTAVVPADTAEVALLGTGDVKAGLASVELLNGS